MEEENRGKQTEVFEQDLDFTKQIDENFSKLPKFEQFFFNYGCLVLGASGSVCGILAHKRFQRILKLPKQYLKYSLPLVLVPMVSTCITYYTAVTQPLLLGTLKCPVCAEVRSGLTGASSCALAPVFLASFINVRRLPVSNVAPTHGNLFMEMMMFAKPVFIRLKYFMLFQMLISFWMARRHTGTIVKILQMSSEDLAEHDDYYIY